MNESEISSAYFKKLKDFAVAMMNAWVIMVQVIQILENSQELAGKDQ